MVKIRKFWKRNPKTQVKKSDKIYKRNKARRELRKQVKKLKEERDAKK